MLDKRIQQIIEKKQPCFFVSPHFDDAVLSAGGLLSFLSTKIAIHVITIFTKAGKGPDTLSAKAFLKQCHYSNAKSLFIDREKEDANIWDQLGIPKINLGFTDSLWRRKKSFLGRFLPEFEHVYPTYRWHIAKGKIAKEDHRMMNVIIRNLQEIIPHNAVVFCPFAVGNHVDHVITRMCVEKSGRDVIYWSDFPYNTEFFCDDTGFSSFTFAKNLKKKHELVMLYKTQYAAMFPHDFSVIPEKFFYHTVSKK